MDQKKTKAKEREPPRVEKAARVVLSCLAHHKICVTQNVLSIKTCKIQITKPSSKEAP